MSIMTPQRLKMGGHLGKCGYGERSRREAIEASKGRWCQQEQQIAHEPAHLATRDGRAGAWTRTVKSLEDVQCASDTQSHRQNTTAQAQAESLRGCHTCGGPLWQHCVSDQSLPPGSYTRSRFVTHEHHPCTTTATRQPPVGPRRTLRHSEDKNTLLG